MSSIDVPVPSPTERPRTHRRLTADENLERPSFGRRQRRCRSQTTRAGSMQGTQHLPMRSGIDVGGASSSAPPQNTCQLQPPESLNQQTPNQQQRPQVTVRLSSSRDQNRCSPYTRGNRPRRSRQGPPDTYIHMGQCNQVCHHCNAWFWYNERVRYCTRNRI